ncbi:MAG TPA: S26 family signal peptidase [Gemmataceae bacterium]
MPYLPVLVLGLLALVNLFVAAFLLWLSCKICRVRRAGSSAAPPPPVAIRYRRALAVVLGLWVCGLVALAALWLIVPRQLWQDVTFSAFILLLHIVILLAFVRLFVCPTLGRTVLVAVVFQVLAIAYVVGFVFAVSQTLTSGYIQSTGSMAETVWGYHKDVRCPTCGFDFPINCSAEVDPVDMGRPTPTFACVCPNCRQRIHFPSAPSSFTQFFPDSAMIDDPGVSGGDRFLVGRGLLGADRIVPRRFDLVAHEYPYAKQSMLYLKRLAGLPGETIAISGGELYVLRPDKGLVYEEVEAHQEVKDPQEARTLAHENDPEALARFEKGEFEILRKSPEQILAMRHIVYDNDHRHDKQPPRWTGEDGWNAAGDHRFQIAAGPGERVAWLRYRHLLPDNGGKPALIADLTGYNTYQGGMHRDPLLDKNWVGDLILECEATIDNPQGELTLELSRGVDRFRARWDLASGVCTLVRVHKDGEKELESKPTAMNRKGAYRLRFANVDQRLCVWVNDERPFGEGVAYTAAKQLGPDANNDLEPAGIAARGAGVEVSKLKLFHDVYYTAGQIPNEPDVPGIDFADPSTWDDLRKPPVRTFYVQPNHYFVLGDNSAESSDSRSWGSLPHRLLLGRAFFVYYPLKRVGPLH